MTGKSAQGCPSMTPKWGLNMGQNRWKGAEIEGKMYFHGVQVETYFHGVQAEMYFHDPILGAAFWAG